MNGEYRIMSNMDDKCQVPHFTKDIVLEATDQTETITLSVKGMGCINCANRAHNGLIDHPGVVAAAVSQLTETADVTFIPAKVSVPQLIAMVARAGDQRHMYRTTLVETGGRE
jgi:copper chaperone CopZ